MNIQQQGIFFFKCNQYEAMLNAQFSVICLLNLYKCISLVSPTPAIPEFGMFETQNPIVCEHNLLITNQQYLILN